MYIQDAIHLLRTQTRKTQAQLASDLNVSVVSVSRWESGRAIPRAMVSRMLIELSEHENVTEECRTALREALALGSKAARKPPQCINHVSLKGIIDRLPSGIGVYHVYKNGTIEEVYINDGYFAMIGATRKRRKRFSGSAVLDAVERGDRQILLNEVRAALNENRPVCAQLRILTESNTYKWLELRANIIEREPERCTLYCCFTDIDRRKELQHEAEMRFQREAQLLRELNRDAVTYFVVNITQRVVEEYCNLYEKEPHLRAPFNLTEEAEEAMLASIVTVDAKAVREGYSVDAMRERFESGETSVQLEYRRTIPGQGPRWMRATCSVMKRPSTDDIVGFVTIVDIDVARKRQMALHSIVNEEMESVILVNPRTLNIILAQENRCLPGYRVGSCFPLNNSFREALFQGLHPDDVQRCSDFIRTDTAPARLAEQPVLTCIYRVIASDGRIERKKVRAFYLDDTKDEIVYVRQDITDLYEEEQRQKQALQAAIDEANHANQAKSDFLSRISHDMRTPLNALLGLTDDALTSDANETDLRDMVRKVHASGEYLLGIINDVLDMSKIESNKLVLHPEPYPLGEFITRVQTIIGERCKAKGVRFVLRADESPEHALLLDKLHFDQIFINLLSNAVRFTPSGGTVELLIGHGERRDGLVQTHLVVRDTGVGMSPDFLPHAFERFSQEVQPDSTPNKEGTGLGLSIVKQLVDLMHGRISVDSTLGKGTTFTVDMQVLIAPSAAPVGEPAEERDLCGLRILLCEDHPLNTEIAVRLLRKKGCVVDCAENGEEGLRKFRDSALWHYDLILMDLRMPVMDGLDATRKIRALNRRDAASVPIVAMTANAFEEDVRRSLEAGMNAHLSKPFVPAKLYQVIAQLARFV